LCSSSPLAKLMASESRVVTCSAISVIPVCVQSKLTLASLEVISPTAPMAVARAATIPVVI
jgi:hypothetical protein